MKSIKTIFLFGLMLMQYQLIAQSIDCKSRIMTYIEEMSSFKEPGPGKAYSLIMSIRNHSVVKSDIPDKVDIDATLTNSKLVYTSSLMSVYQDTINAFTILHPSKTIIWNKGQKNPIGDEQQQLLMNVQLELLKNSSITICEEQEIDAEKYIIMGIQPTKTVMDQMKVDHIMFYFNIKRNQIDKIIIDYNSEYPLDSQEIIYKELNFNAKQKVKPILEYVFDKAGNLNNEYEGYKLIDNRG